MTATGLTNSGWGGRGRRLLVALACLAMPVGCAKADFGPDGGGGGAVEAGTGGAGEVTGGTGGDDATGGAGGEPIDGPSDDDAAPDAAVDEAPSFDLPSEEPLDSGPDGDAGVDGAPDDAGDGPSGVMPTVPGQLLISEVMYDSAALSDDFGEWFEVYNPSPDVTYNLAGCTLSDKSPSHAQLINRPVIIPPLGYRTFALSTDPGFTPDYVYTGVKFDNDLEDAVTLTCGTMIIDQFIYTPPTPGIPGRSLSVDPNHLNAADHNQPMFYCRGQTPYHTTASGIDYGTPGAPNPACQ